MFIVWQGLGGAWCSSQATRDESSGYEGLLSPTGEDTSSKMAQLGEGQGVSHPSRRWCYATLQQSDGTPLMVSVINQHKLSP